MQTTGEVFGPRQQGGIRIELWAGLFLGFFVSPFFFHGFGWFLFGFFFCVLTFSHGGAPCECGIVGLSMKARILLRLVFLPPRRHWL